MQVAVAAAPAFGGVAAHLAQWGFMPLAIQGGFFAVGFYMLTFVGVTAIVAYVVFQVLCCDNQLQIPFAVGIAC